MSVEQRRTILMRVHWEYIETRSIRFYRDVFCGNRFFMPNAGILRARHNDVATLIDAASCTAVLQMDNSKARHIFLKM